MATKFEKLTEAHIEFIEAQKIFFVGTGGETGTINISPKGLDSFRVINQSKVVWLNLTGSGNETAAHVRESNRMTIMFCSFNKQPLILRLYGNSKVIHPRNLAWESLVKLFPENNGARQIFDLDINLVQASCGFGVPYYELLGERPTLTKWSEKHGANGIVKYWKDRNKESIDGKETGIIDEDA